MRMSATSGGGVNLGVIITPFLDMAFQLLAFFIMTYNPSAFEGHIQGSLAPKGDNIIVEWPEGDEPNGPKLEATTFIIVHSVQPGQIEGRKHDGEPSRILMKRMEDGAAITIADAETSFDEGLAKLERELRTAAKAGAGGKVHIESDGNLKHQYLMRVYDVCRSAGGGDVTFVGPVLAKR